MQATPAKKPGHARPKTAAPAAAADIHFQKLFVTTDFSDAALAGVRCAVALAKQLGLDATLLHVVEPPTRLGGMEAVALARTEAEVAALARKQLAALAGRERVSGVRLTASVRTGKPVHEITAAAGEGGADLLVMATLGRTGWQRALLGSTAERVVRHAPCPVLTVPSGAGDTGAGKVRPFQLQKLVVPVDFSRLAQAALPWATFLAAQFGAELVLLNVVEKFPIDYLLGQEQTADTLARLRTQAAAELEPLAADLVKATGLKVSVVVRDGTPYTEICQAAETLGADLIVLTTHGYTGLQQVWLGSTAERVVRHASCPVLTVRELNQKNV